MTKVVLNSLSKTYKGEKKTQNFEALKNASFEVESGEFLVLVGPSGCGKSTLLRMLSGLEEITSGELYFDDKLVNEVEPKNRNIGMVFQDYALYPHLTVAENIAFPLSIAKVSKQEIKQRVNEVAELIDVKELLGRKPKQLSGGQRQRVALGRAISKSPSLYLFDEPLSNLDAKLRVQMRTEIQSLQRKLNTTTVYVTHDQTEAMTMGDRLVVLNEGVLQQIDTPDNIYNNPINKFVAGFIGSPQMNFFEGIVSLEGDIKFTEKGTQSVFELGGANIERDNLSEGRKVTLGIRPENLSIGSAEQVKNQLRVRVENIENLGYESFIYFKTNYSFKCLRVEGRADYRVGDVLHCNYNPKGLFLFNEQDLRI